MQELQHDLVSLEEIVSPTRWPSTISTRILRLDKIHPIISGNKWYKLQFHLSEAMRLHKKRIVTWGGAWSNHLLATAAACHSLSLACLGIIRGDRPEILSLTLKEAEKLGMQLHFISREEYRQQRVSTELITPDDWEIPEGGYSELGVRGASTIAGLFEPNDFTHIICAVGTGTMMAGIINAVPSSLRVIGIPVLKGSEALEQAIKKMLRTDHENWELIPGFEWGGYAKHPQGLLDFMNQWYQETRILTDIVYTSKLCYAVNNLMAGNFFPPESKILIIHSGGLQGNRSLAKGALFFE